MAKLPLRLLIFLCVLGSASLMAQGFSIDKTTIKVEREFVKAPVFTVSRSYGKLTKSNETARWLQFLISYTPASAGKQVVWEDDLTVELIVLLPAKKDQGYGNVIMLTGKQVLYSVPGDKKTHYILFHIPPAVLLKYTSIAKFDTKTSESSVYVAVVFRRGRNNQVLATGYGSMKNRSVADIAKLFDQYHNSRFRVMKLENEILPKDRSPWQWIDTDYFDIPKSLMEGKK